MRGQLKSAIQFCKNAPLLAYAKECVSDEGLDYVYGCLIDDLKGVLH